jgi:hypothetical protein
MSSIERSLCAVTIIILTLTIHVPAWAGGELPPDRFTLRLGGYSVKNATSIARLDATNYPVGTYLDFSETLGGQTSATVARLDGRYRFNERHGVGFAWYDIKFTGSRVLGRDIIWGDLVFPLSTQVDSELKYTVYKLNYQYSLYHNDKVELGGLAGFHVMHTSASINASGIGQSLSEAVTAPLPVFGLYANYAFTPRFSFYYNYQFMFINYDNKIKGGLQDFLFGLEYRLFQNIAAGVTYNRFAVDIKATGDKTTLYFDASWNGLMLYGAVYF